MLKYYIIVSLRQFAKILNHFSDLSRTNENLEICMPVWLVQFNEFNSLDITAMIIILQ